MIFNFGHYYVFSKYFERIRLGCIKHTSHYEEIHSQNCIAGFVLLFYS